MTHAYRITPARKARFLDPTIRLMLRMVWVDAPELTDSFLAQVFSVSPQAVVHATRRKGLVQGDLASQWPRIKQLFMQESRTNDERVWSNALGFVQKIAVTTEQALQKHAKLAEAGHASG